MVQYLMRIIPTEQFQMTKHLTSLNKFDLVVIQSPSILLAIVPGLKIVIFYKNKSNNNYYITYF